MKSTLLEIYLAYIDFPCRFDEVLKSINQCHGNDNHGIVTQNKKCY